MQQPLALGLGADARRDVAGDHHHPLPLPDHERHGGHLQQDPVPVAVLDRHWYPGSLAPSSRSCTRRRALERCSSTMRS